MKVVILSGGKGIKGVSKSGEFISKSLIMVNDFPLIYYILKHLYFYGITNVILCVDSNSEGSINNLLEGKNNKPEFKKLVSKLNLNVVNAGKIGKTGSMLFTIKELLQNEDFIVTYNDIITDVNLSKLIQFHKSKGKILTVTGVHPTIRHGIIKHKLGLISEYKVDEQIQSTIKGGYFILKPDIFNYLSADCMLENEPFQKLISEKQAVVFEHTGFWKQFDSYKHIEEMERLFKDENPPWLIQ